LIQDQKQASNLDSKKSFAWILSFQILISQFLFGYFFDSIGHNRKSGVAAAVPRLEIGTRTAVRAAVQSFGIVRG